MRIHVFYSRICNFDEKKIFGEVILSDENLVFVKNLFPYVNRFFGLRLFYVDYFLVNMCFLVKSLVRDGPGIKAF